MPQVLDRLSRAAPTPTAPVLTRLRKDTVFAQFAREAVAPTRETAEFGLEVGGAGASTLGHLLASPERRRAALRGLREGALAGARTLTPAGLRALGEAAATEIAAAARTKTPAELAGRVVGEAALMLVPGAATREGRRLIRSLRGVRPAPFALETAQETLARVQPTIVTTGTAVEPSPLRRVPYRGVEPVRATPVPSGFQPSTQRSLEDILTEVLEEARRPEPPRKTSLPPPPYSLGAGPGPEQPRVTVPSALERAGAERRIAQQALKEARKEQVTVPPAFGRAGPVTTGARGREPVERAYEKVIQQRGRAEGPLAETERRLARRAREEMLPGAREPVREARLPLPPEATARAAETLGLTLPPGARITRVAREPVANLRRMEGAERAARQLGIGGKAGTAAVRRFVGGPSQRPLGAEERIARAARKATEETGRISPQALATIAGAGAGAAFGGAVGGPTLDDRIGAALVYGLVGAAGARQLTRLAQRSPDLVDKLLAVRVEAYLSGTALPKNVLTALGAPALTAAETGRLAPLRQYPRLVTDVGKALVHPQSALDIDVTRAGRRPRGPFSRRIAAVDEAAIRALERSGLTTEQINRALVRTPLAETIGRGNVMADLLESRFGQFIQPFQRTPFDVGIGGLTEVRELLGGPAVKGAVGTAGRRRALTATLMAAGAGAGELTSGDELAPLKVALLAAALGRRAVPFSMGAAVTGGRRMLLGTSPLPEFGLDPGQWVPTTPEDIALVRLVRRLQGR